MSRPAPHWTPEEDRGFRFSLRLRRSVDRMMDSANVVRARRGTESEYQVVAGLHLNHAYVLQASIHMLCRDGRATAVLPSLRALLETFAGLRFIADSDSQRKAIRFIEFAAVLRYRKFGVLSGLPHWQADPLQRKRLAAVEPEIRTAYEDYCTKYCKEGTNPSMHWHGMTVKRLFEQTGLKGAYGTAYQPWCDAVHANVDAFRDYVVPLANDQGESLMITRGRTKTGARDVLVHSCLFLVGVAEAWANALQLGDAALARLHRRLDQCYDVFDMPRPDVARQLTCPQSRR